MKMPRHFNPDSEAGLGERARPGRSEPHPRGSPGRVKFSHGWKPATPLVRREGAPNGSRGDCPPGSISEFGLNATGASHRKTATVRPLRDQSGSAVVIVLVLAFIMCMLISDNGLVLHHLKKELQLVEKKQLQHHETRLNRIRLRSTQHPTEVLPALAGTNANERP